jgi:iron complex transport system substrate-binding protein
MRKWLSAQLAVWLLLTASACTQTSSLPDSTQQQGITFTDALGRAVTVDHPVRVGIASGSFAECWQLAGGSAAAVTQDALDDSRLVFSEETVSLGSLKEPSLEAILAAQLDFLILLPSLKSHLALDEALSKANVPHAYLEVESFEHYLSTLKLFTDITQRKDLYEKNGTQVALEIDALLAQPKPEPAPRVLLLRASGGKITARNSDSMTGKMLKELGCSNIADQKSGLLEDLSLEVISQEDPDFILVVPMGEEDEAQAQLDELLSSNPLWAKLTAVRQNRVYLLDKELFHYKPNARWGESYETLAAIFQSR